MEIKDDADEEIIVESVGSYNILEVDSNFEPQYDEHGNYVYPDYNYKEIENRHVQFVFINEERYRIIQSNYNNIHGV